MAEVEAKISTSPSPASKKSRKNKAPTPIYRTSPMGCNRDSTESPARSASPIEGSRSPIATAFKPPTPNLDLSKKPSGEAPIPPGPGGGIRSYSDFMRSLAAKYNNNE